MAKTKKSNSHCPSSGKKGRSEKQHKEKTSGGKSHANRLANRGKGVDPPCIISLHSGNILMAQVVRVRKLLARFIDFVAELYLNFLKAVFSLTVLLTLLALPTTMIIMGVLNIFECPLMDNIPICLFIGGMIGLAAVILHMPVTIGGWNVVDWETIKFKPVDRILLGATFSWLFYDSISVYGLDGVNFDPEKGLHCDKTLYLFAFWVITFSLIILTLIIFGLAIRVAAEATIYSAKRRRMH